MAQPEDRSTALVPASPADIAKTSTGEPDNGALQDGLIGETLHDTYSVVRFLAEGGMGRVHEAQHTRISTKRFAIKVLHAELKHSIDVRMRFRREAEAAAAIEHANIVGVHGLRLHVRRPAFTSSAIFSKGASSMPSSRTTRRSPFRSRRASRASSCRALEAAHDKGALHPSRSQARERLLVGGARRCARREGPRLRSLEDARARRRDRHANGHRDGNAVVHGARASEGAARGSIGADIYGCRWPSSYAFASRAALPTKRTRRTRRSSP